jgi:hypothetical protein
MAVSDKSGNGVVPNVGSGAGPGWSLWRSTTNGAGAPVPWSGGRGALVIAGAMGGGTVSLAGLFTGKDPDTPVSATGIGLNGTPISATAVGIYTFDAPACDLVPSLAGSAGASVSVGIDVVDSD